MYYELYFEEHKSYQKSYHSRDGGRHENLRVGWLGGNNRSSFKSRSLAYESTKIWGVEGQLPPCPCLVTPALHFIKRSGNRQDVGRPSVTTDDRTGKYLAHADFPLFCVNKVVKISVTGYFQINLNFLIQFTYFVCQIRNCSRSNM